MTPPGCLSVDREAEYLIFTGFIYFIMNKFNQAEIITTMNLVLNNNFGNNSNLIFSAKIHW